MRFILPLFALASPLGATTILLDLGPTATTGTPSTWNNFNGSYTVASSTTLVDTSNNATGYTFAISGSLISPSVADNSTSAGRVSATVAPFNIASVMADSIYAGSQRTLTLSGLNPAVAYTIAFYSYVDRVDSRQTQFTINSVTQTVEPANGTAGGTLTFSNIFPDSSGKIETTVVKAASNAGNNWILNAVSITYTIPEPSAALLSAIGLLPLLRRRR